MAMVYLELALTLLFVHMLAGYDSRYQSCKAFTIKSPFLCKLLLSPYSFYRDDRGKRLVRDRSKISIWGVCYYVAAAVVLLLHLLLVLLPDMPMEPWIVETGRFLVFATTLNEKLSAILILLLFLSVLGHVAHGMIQSARDAGGWLAKTLLWLFAICGLLLVVGGSVMLWIELACSIWGVI